MWCRIMQTRWSSVYLLSESKVREFLTWYLLSESKVRGLTDLVVTSRVYTCWANPKSKGLLTWKSLVEYVLAEQIQSQIAYWLCDHWSRIHLLGDFWRNLSLWILVIHSLSKPSSFWTSGIWRHYSLNEWMIWLSEYIRV